MVLIKRGIVWGEWQRSEACVPIQQSILSAKSYSELNLVIDHHKHWNPEDPVCEKLNIIFRFMHGYI